MCKNTNCVCLAHTAEVTFWPFAFETSRRSVVATSPADWVLKEQRNKCEKAEHVGEINKDSLSKIKIIPVSQLDSGNINAKSLFMLLFSFHLAT